MDGLNGFMVLGRIVDALPPQLRLQFLHNTLVYLRRFALPRKALQHPFNCLD